MSRHTHRRTSGRWRACALAPLLLLPAFGSGQQAPHHVEDARPQVLAPGYSALEFPAPVPGSYALPPLGAAADGELLDSAGNAVTLHGLFRDRTVVLSFIFTTCPDVNGCPLATFVLGRVQQRLAADEKLRDAVRLISVSFDPFNDSPDVMANYGKSFRQHEVDWRFLTAASEQTLAPILDDYGQAVIRDVDPSGKPRGTMSHILRVFLIDAEGKVRNIYSPSFLHPDVLLADIVTVTARDGS